MGYQVIRVRPGEGTTKIQQSWRLPTTEERSGDTARTHHEKCIEWVHENHREALHEGDLLVVGHSEYRTPVSVFKVGSAPPVLPPIEIERIG